MDTFRRASVGQGARTLAGQDYTADDIFRLDAARLFYADWVCVGRADAIPEAGDYFLAPIIAESIIVVRGQGGRIYAHANVCRHRGARLCQDERGRFPGGIQCPYHAWTYGLDGQLLAARLMHDVADFERGEYPLHPVAVAEWEGFLFLNLSRQPRPFAQVFAPLLGRFRAWGMPGLRLGRRIEYEVAANWKLIVENYSECYHCPLIHPALCELSPPTSGRNDLLEGPFLGGYMDLKTSIGSMTIDGHTGRRPLAALAGDDLARVYYYSIFPNLLLSLHPDYVMAHTLWPQSAGRTRVVCEWYFDPAEMARPGFDPSDAVDFWDMTNRQDWVACEISQQGLASRYYTPGPYSHTEGLLWAFGQEYLKRRLAGTPG